MSEQTIQEIADAAIAYIEGRLKATALKDERAGIVSSEPCANHSGDAPDCYYQNRLFFNGWCARCQRARIAHINYRKAVAARTAALVRLKRLVTQRSLAAAA